MVTLLMEVGEGTTIKTEQLQQIETLLRMRQLFVMNLANTLMEQGLLNGSLHIFAALYNLVLNFCIVDSFLLLVCFMLAMLMVKRCYSFFMIHDMIHDVGFTMYRYLPYITNWSGKMMIDISICIPAMYFSNERIKVQEKNYRMKH